jgi:LuxR family transcriptional regulator, maltose regulon positive regulatory protein
VLNDTRPLGVDPRSVLSPREVQVMEIAAQGYTNQEVAARLNVSVHAVKFHLAAIYRKLGVANRTEAAVLFHTAGSASGPQGDGGPRL